MGFRECNWYEFLVFSSQSWAKPFSLYHSKPHMENNHYIVNPTKCIQVNINISLLSSIITLTTNHIFMKPNWYAQPNILCCRKCYTLATWSSHRITRMNYTSMTIIPLVIWGNSHMWRELFELIDIWGSRRALHGMSPSKS